MASPGFVILNEVKNLTHPTDKILRCAQDDKQGAGNREREIARLVVHEDCTLPLLHLLQAAQYNKSNNSASLKFTK